MKSAYLGCYLFVLFLMFGSYSYAGVDVHNANFFHSWVDGEYILPDTNWQLQRSYNSRENRVGIFGHGWCSPLETKLTVDGKNIQIRNCGSGAVVQYVKTSEKWISGEDEITESPAGWNLKSKGVLHLQFNKKGFIEALWVKDSKAHVSYLKDRISYVEIDGSRIQFTLNSQNLVSEIKFPKGEKAEYQYKDQNLIAVKNFWNNKQSYSYDQEHNMTKASFSNGKSIELTYDLLRDWVLSFKDVDACFEKYTYTHQKLSDGGAKILTNVERNCPSVAQNDSKASFTDFEVTTSKGNQVAEVKQIQDGKMSHVIYDLKSNKPLKIQEASGDIKEYKYNELGQIITRKSKNGELTFVRNPDGRLQGIRFEDKTYLKVVLDQRLRPILLELAPHKKIAIGYQLSSEKIKSILVNDKEQILYDGPSEVVQVRGPASVDNSINLRLVINEVYGLYMMSTDESFIYGGMP